jgi:hypothetical protein
MAIIWIAEEPIITMLTQEYQLKTQAVQYKGPASKIHEI